MYVHRSDVYVRVLTFTNTFYFLQTRTYHVKTFTYLFVQLMLGLRTLHEMYVHPTYTLQQCTYTVIFFWFQLFELPCWLACRLRLAAAGCHA